MKQILKVFWLPILCTFGMFICAILIRLEFGANHLVYWLSLMACAVSATEIHMRIESYAKVLEKDKK